MFNSPFEHLGKPQVEHEGVPVEGIFSCLTDGCYEDVVSAKFNEKTDSHTWVCEAGHLSVPGGTNG